MRGDIQDTIQSILLMKINTMIFANLEKNKLGDQYGYLDNSSNQVPVSI